jgi:Flp pilus assembly protein TadD
MSRSLGIETVLLEVQRDPEIDRQDSLVVVNRHVAAAYSSGPQMAIFDFFLSSDAPVIGREVIDDVFASAIHHNNLGGVALRENRLDVALKNFEITTTLAPTWPSGWVNLGVARIHEDDVPGALAAYGRALEIDPRNSSALNNLSILYGRLGRYNDARLALTEAARRGKSPFVLVALADAEMLSGRLEEARKYLRRAKRLDPDEPEVWDALARLARRTGQERLVAKYRQKADALRLEATGAR